MECQEISLICDQHILFIQQIYVEHLLSVVAGPVLHIQGTAAAAVLFQAPFYTFKVHQHL